MSECAGCGGSIDEAFQYCPWCGWTQEPKLTEFFNPHAVVERERGGALRVSRYLGKAPAKRHIRFSVWNRRGQAEAAISIDEPEARRLAEFLVVPSHGTAHPSRLELLIEWLRSSLARTG
jgi:hypothetical protein